ncbi:MAG: MFS transporter, partial [Cohnella sp.]|nr:MFS transporter [Cohnella sp.]
VLWVGTGLIPLFFPEDSWIPIYIAIWLLSNLANQACAVIWTSLMADIVPAAVRGKYFGIRNTIHWFVVSATLLFGGQLMEWLPGTKGYAVLFLISGACVVWNGWALSRYPNPPFTPSENGRSLRMLKKPFSDRRFRSATLFIAGFMLVQNIVIPLFSYVMLEIANLSTSKVTAIIMLQNIVMMVSYYYWGVLNGRFSTDKLLMWTFPIIAASCAAWAGMAIMPVIAVLIVVHIVLGFGLAGYNLLVFNFLIGDTPSAERPIYIAVFSALTGLAGFLGPTIGGWLYDMAKDGPEWMLRYGIATFAGLALMALGLLVGPVIFKRASISA